MPDLRPDKHDFTRFGVISRVRSAEIRHPGGRTPDLRSQWTTGRTVLNFASVTYQDVVEKLKISQDRVPDRSDRFKTFKTAVWFYRSKNPLKAWPTTGKNVILVAGTNGKGTVSKTLETLLVENETPSVGLFTSPHLIEPTERIRSHGRDLNEDELVRTYELIESVIAKFDLSHFEILTLMMIEVFFGGRVREIVDYAVIEVGVGGRLDPTRAVPHETAVLARIGLDHEAILGSTLTQIATEKLAIAEGANRLIYLRPDFKANPDLQTVFDEAKMKFSNCEFFEAREFPSEIEFKAQTTGPSTGETNSKLKIPRWLIKSPWGKAPLALLGERAVQNSSLALEVLHRCGFDVAQVLPSLENVKWPGRMEKLTFKGRDVYLSGDHNEQGVQSLVDLLSRFAYENLWLVVGVGKGKPIATMLALYKQIRRAKIILTRTKFRPIDMAALNGYAHDAVAVEESAIRALTNAIDRAGAGDLVVVSGSLYLVGDLRAAILKQNQ